MALARRIPTISPQTYARVAAVAAGSLIVIVLTGAAVRLTGSGLGCPTWPECHGHFITTQLSYHGAIEYGNRLFTGFVAVAAIAAVALAFLRRPFRRDLAALAVLLPIGVLAQAVIGGMAVLHGLAPGFVMAHFCTSMLIVAAGLTVAWRARTEPGRPAVNERSVVLAVRALVPLAAWVLFMGTVATASGPHPGASGGVVVHRLGFHGANTMDWVIHWHGRFATLLGLCSLAAWYWARRQAATPGLRRALTRFCLLLGTQGVVGGIQYELGLPAGIVWVHVGLAALTWVSLIWAVAQAGRLAPRPAVQPVLAAPAAPPTVPAP